VVKLLVMELVIRGLGGVVEGTSGAKPNEHVIGPRFQGLGDTLFDQDVSSFNSPRHRSKWGDNTSHRLLYCFPCLLAL
jgi:hypothetical protein